MILIQAADSLANAVGSEVGAQVSLLLLSGLAVVNKVIVDGAKKLLGKVAELPDGVKATVAFGFAQFITFVNAKYGIGASPDIDVLATSAQGAVVWGLSMGWNALSGVIFKKTA